MQEKKQRKPVSYEARRKMSEAAKKRNPEAEARRIAALREAKKKEDPSYRHTPEYREKQRKATKKKWESGAYEGRSEKSAATIAAWSEEQRELNSRNRSEAKRKEWAQAKAEGRRRNIHFGTTKRVSKHELALIPYMKALGFEHNQKLHIGHRVPDFIDHENKRIYEYFGSYWHKPGDDTKTKEFYSLRGWNCTVLWEQDLYSFLAANKELVTEEEHQDAWKAAKVNNGYLKPGV